MTNRYTNIVLTVIAGALVLQAAQLATRPASADIKACTTRDPCAVYLSIREDKYQEFRECFYGSDCLRVTVKK